MKQSLTSNEALAARIAELEAQAAAKDAASALPTDMEAKTYASRFRAAVEALPGDLAGILPPEAIQRALAARGATLEALTDPDPQTARQRALLLADVLRQAAAETIPADFFGPPDQGQPLQIDTLPTPAQTTPETPASQTDRRSASGRARVASFGCVSVQ